MEIVELACVPATGGDRIVDAGNVVVALDAVTPRMSGLDAADVADAAADALSDVRSVADVEEVLHRAMTSLAVGRAAAVVFAALDTRTREVVRVGDVSVLVDGAPVPQATAGLGESIAADARALWLRAALARGEDLRQLRRDDRSRHVIAPLLEAARDLRHVDGPYGIPAVDGSSTRPRAERFVLPADASAVVLATDGYAPVLSTLARSEAVLGERLQRDPLMMESPPATKGSPVDGVSFDDRAYVRILL